MKSLFLIFGVCQAKSKYHFTKRISATIDDTIYSVEGECDAACQEEKYKEAEEYLKNKVCQESFKKNINSWLILNIWSNIEFPVPTKAVGSCQNEIFILY